MNSRSWILSAFLMQRCHCYLIEFIRLIYFRAFIIFHWQCQDFLLTFLNSYLTFSPFILEEDIKGDVMQFRVKSTQILAFIRSLKLRSTNTDLLQPRIIILTPLYCFRLQKNILRLNMMTGSSDFLSQGWVSLREREGMRRWIANSPAPFILILKFVQAIRHKASGP